MSLIDVRALGHCEGALRCNSHDDGHEPDSWWLGLGLEHQQLTNGVETTRRAVEFGDPLK